MKLADVEDGHRNGPLFVCPCSPMKLRDSPQTPVRRPQIMAHRSAMRNGPGRPAGRERLKGRTGGSSNGRRLEGRGSPPPDADRNQGSIDRVPAHPAAIPSLAMISRILLLTTSGL